MKTFLLVQTAAIAIGIVLDVLFGDPCGKMHPVCVLGRWIGWLEKKMYRDSVSAGAKLVVCVLVPALCLVLSAEVAAYRIGAVCFLITEALLVFFMLALRTLYQESMQVYSALLEGNTVLARKKVSRIVGRDTDRLDTEGIIRAAVETVAENTSDGVIAPYFYMILFGGAGAVFYKAVNTMDSMVGYQNLRYSRFGRAAAKLDDAVNYLPSRLSAVFMLAASLFCGLNYRSALRIFRRDRRKHASPNSAQTESVCAGALDVALSGDAWYGGIRFEKPVIGDAVRTIEAEDIRRADRLMLTASFLGYVVLLVLRIVIICNLK